MTKYKEFRKKYLASGLSQKAFAKQEGVSVGTANSYINKGKTLSSNNGRSVFTPMEVSKPASKSITIKTGSGITIEIPI